MRISRRVALTGIACAPLLIGSRARAEVAALPPTLAGCLDTVYWNARERGPLLVVAPERAVAWNKMRGAERLPAGEEPENPGKPGANGYPFYAVAPYYGRKVVPVGAMSAVVPTRMVTLRYDDLPLPDMSSGLTGGGRVVMLLATLDEKQWRLVLGANGIGRGNLKQAQRAVWDALFGAVQITRIAPPAPGQEHNMHTEVPSPGPDAMRFRIYRTLAWQYLFQDKSRGTLSLGVGGTPVKAVTHSASIREPIGDATLHDYEHRNSLINGVSIVNGSPNRAKPADLDYAASVLDAAVSLADVQTIEQLMVRIREATRLEVHADIRYRELPVHVRTAPGADSARAGDLLKAIAYSVTGTVRRVADASNGSAFVLTDDRVGLGTRHAVIADWLRAHANTLETAKKSAMEGFRIASEGSPYLWSDAEGTVPSAELQEKISGWESQPPASNLVSRDNPSTVAVSELPAESQEKVRSEINYWKNESAKPDSDRSHYRPIRADVVVPRSAYQFAVVVPGIGSIDIGENSSPGVLSPGIGSTWNRPRQDETAELPVRLSGASAPVRAIAVSVRSAEEAVSAARLSVTKNFNRLYLDVPMETETEAVTAWASAASADAKLSVHLFVRPLWTAKETGEPDRNRLGETWQQFQRRRARLLGTKTDASETLLFAGDPATKRAIVDRLSEWVRLPGVSGMALAGTPPEGYTRSRTFMFGLGDQGTTFTESGEFGFAAGARLAFLREQGIDPVDLSPLDSFRLPGEVWAMTANRGRDLQLPFFTDYGPMTTGMRNNTPVTEMGAKKGYLHWNDFRMAPIWGLRKAVADAVGATTPAPKVDFLIAEGEARFQRLLPWSDDLAKPAPAAGRGQPPPTPAVYHSLVSVQESVFVGGAPQPDTFARQVAYLLPAFRVSPQFRAENARSAPKATARNGGFLLNFSGTSLPDVEILLKNIVIEP
ncbi:MAG: hypothetical protein H7145_20265 [Akkermansiaceae bacterium]|nr:hypothetical protein [Armatimonadota bacterium]